MNVMVVGSSVVSEIQTRFSDFDPLQHLNNSSYLSYVEVARINTFAGVLGVDLQAYTGVVKRTSVEYKKPVNPGTPIVVITEIKEIGDKSLELDFKVANKFDHSQVYASVEMTQITVSLKTLKPANHPEVLLDHIQRLQAGEMDTGSNMKAAS